MQFDVSSRTIYAVRHGSHAYGTSTPTSDLDIKGVCIPPVDYYLGFAFKFEQEERLVSKGSPEDKVTYSIEKFCKLAADSNPNIIEVLSVDESDILKVDYFGRRLREARDLFLSKRARYSFSGYARAQLKRIQTHKRWLMDAHLYERPCPTREECGLPKLADEGQKNQIAMGLAEVQKQLDEWNVDLRGLEEHDKVHLRNKMSEFLAYVSIDRDELWSRAAVARFGADDNLIHRLQQERSFANKVSDWEKYQDWKRSRNPARAQLEAKFGFDTKHAGHLIRLMRMCKEILEGKGVIVKRPDAVEILAIRAGAWTYERVIEEADRLDAECNALYETSKLQHHPDAKKLNDLCVELVSEYHRLYR